MTLREYIEKQGVYSFQEKPFNEVDNILFSNLSYIDFREILPIAPRERLRLSEVCQKFTEKYDKKARRKLTTAPFIQAVLTDFLAMAETKRYRDVFLFHYVWELEYNSQFSALSFDVGDGFLYVSFGGTDESLVSWKEDFRLSYEFPVLAQEKASQYLRKSISFFGPKIRVGGHSKGGNLAMASYLLSPFWVRRKVQVVYNNDGPGFREKEFTSRRCKEMVHKLHMLIPEQSVFGVLLRHPSNYAVVKSSSLGLFQHDSTTWIVKNTTFERGKKSKWSERIEKRIFEWISSYPDEERESLIQSFFSVLERAGITKLSDFRLTKLEKILSIIKENQKLEKEEKEQLIHAFRRLLSPIKEEER